MIMLRRRVAGINAGVVVVVDEVVFGDDVQRVIGIVEGFMIAAEAGVEDAHDDILSGIAFVVHGDHGDLV